MPAYPHEIVLEAITYVLSERRRMLQALIEMGHDQAYELEPRKSRLGSPDDPFILVAAPGGPHIARYYIEANEERCWVRLHGTEEFVAKVAAIALRDGGHTLQ